MMMQCTLMVREFALRKPFVTSAFTLHSRHIIYLQVFDPDSGLFGYGEAAPLEQFGTGTFDDSLGGLNEVLPSLSSCTLHQDLVYEMDGRFPDLQKVPAARFAVESALLDLLSKREEKSLAKYLHPEDVPSRIFVNAVLGGQSEADSISAALQAVADGFSCLKIKVGMSGIDEDVHRIAAIRAAVGNLMLLRLDANGAWSADEALMAANALDRYDIEYIEQPVPAHDLGGLQYLTEFSPIPIAADESVTTVADAGRILREDAADILILKPMALGSLLKSRRIALDARRIWKDVVFTSLIDSALGRKAVAQLAASLGGGILRHHGLATGRLFAEDIAVDDISYSTLLLGNKHGIGVEPEFFSKPDNRNREDSKN